MMKFCYSTWFKGNLDLNCLWKPFSRSGQEILKWESIYIDQSAEVDLDKNVFVNMSPGIFFFENTVALDTGGMLSQCNFDVCLIYCES